MMRKLYCNSIIEGLLRGVILFLIIDYSVSVYSASIKRDVCILIAGIGFSVISSFFLLNLLNQKRINKKERILSFLIGTALFWSVNIIAFFNDFTLRFHCFPYREMESGEGFTIVFLCGVYILVTIVFRLFLLAVLFVRNGMNR